MSTIRIAPSILSADFACLRDEIQAIESAGADMLHLDIMDGHFVPNLTFGPPVIAKLRKVTKLPLDVHLMIEQPDASIQAYADAGADHIIVHAEACVHLQRTLSCIRKLGLTAGVALNPATPLSALDYVFDTLDMILIMTVNPGFGGQHMLPSMISKIRNLRTLLAAHNASHTIIEVDGGITPETISELSEAGASWFVAGSAVFGTPNYRAAITALRSAATNASRA